MTRSSMVATFALATALLMGLARPSAANDNCFYKGTMFSTGAASCQSGMQYRCDEVEWVATRETCAGGRADVASGYQVEECSPAIMLSVMKP